MRKLLVFFFTFFLILGSAQVNKNDTIRVENYPTDTISAKKPKSETEVIADIENDNAPAGARPKFNPTRAGLYSAVLPGLGQYYNKKYWKIPVVWGAIGAGVGYTLYSNKQYRKYRNAFVAELNGVPHEFSDRPWIDKTVLGNWQDVMKRRRDYAIAITSLVYVLNIVDAVVDAHLYEGKNDPDLAVRPAIIFDEFVTQRAMAGIGFNFRF